MRHYAYTHTSTEATTGYFACIPTPEMPLEDAFLALALSPLDDFLHRHTLRSLLHMPLDALHTLYATQRPENAQSIVVALLLECALLNPDLAPLQETLPESAYTQSLDSTPLPYIHWPQLARNKEHRAWSALFAANIEQHSKLPHPEELEDEDLTPLYTKEELSTQERITCTMEELHAIHKAHDTTKDTPTSAHDVATRALQTLIEYAIIDGVEMRHEASLSPIALLRPWRLRMEVDCERHKFSVDGQATTYGRGLSLAATRASYSMEMIERASSYVSVKTCEGNIFVQGLQQEKALLHASYEQCCEQNIRALDPNTLPLEIPYNPGDALYWIEAQEAHSAETVLVPFQCVFLFSNLDEKTLFLSAGSTGLAAGSTLAEAKLAALTEVIERDAEAVMPYDRTRCFTLYSRDQIIQSLLDDYAARGVHIHFLDLTTEFGIPCYQAFVMSRTGEIVRATGAHLSGTRAAIAALTEVPWPYPHSPATGPAIRGLPHKCLEDLPNYTLNSPESNVALLEDMLQKHARTPLYVTMTQKDFALPVVRAIIPGLELSPELSSFSRINPRLYANYLRMFGEVF